MPVSWKGLTHGLLPTSYYASQEEWSAFTETCSNLIRCFDHCGMPEFLYTILTSQPRINLDAFTFKLEQKEQQSGEPALWEITRSERHHLIEDDARSTTCRLELAPHTELSTPVASLFTTAQLKAMAHERSFVPFPPMSLGTGHFGRWRRLWLGYR